MDLSHYNTLLQLSVGLNIACIAVYKANVFGQIIETFFTQTTDLISERVNAISKRMSIGQTSLETAKKNGIGKDITPRANDMLRIYNHVNCVISGDNIKQLNDDIDRDYTPKCMSGIATFSTLYAILQLIVILLDKIGLETDSTFMFFSLVSCVPTIIFILTKLFYMHPLYAKIRELKIPYHDLRKNYIELCSQTRNPIKKIWYGLRVCCITRRIIRGNQLKTLGDKSIDDKRKEKVYTLRKKICVFLSVRVAVLLIFTCFILSILLAPYINLSDATISTSKWTAFIVAYIPFIIYAYILFVYERHRKDIIDEFFSDAEEILQSSEKLYEFISDDLKNSRSTNFSS